jgi:hypothetical protein
MWCTADAIEAVAKTFANYSGPEPSRVLLMSVHQHVSPTSQDVLKEEKTAPQDFDGKESTAPASRTE